jgi:hypothetical protein
LQLMGKIIPRLKQKNVFFFIFMSSYVKITVVF